MTILSQLNSPVMYLICGTIIGFVALVCVFFALRAWKAGIAIGMDKTKMKRAVVSSATFAVLPSVRLSVIGALHYETQVAEAAAEAAGLPGLNATHMTAQGFTTIALLMSLCIMWGMLMSILFNKKYLKKLQTPKAGKSGGTGGGFGDLAMTAMFIGLVSAYIGSYLGKFVSGSGLFSFGGSWLPLAVVAVSGAVMAVFVWLAEKKNAAWVENFSIAGSMIAGMAAAVVLNGLL